MRRVVEAAASGRVLGRLPRRTRWWTWPVDVLVHTSDGMLPYRNDQIIVLAMLRRIVGVSNVVVRYFSEPQELLEPLGEARIFRGSRARAVLILSDLEAGARLGRSRSSPRDWQSLQVVLRDAPVALTLSPYGPDDVRIALDEAPVATWDEETRPSHIRRAQRKRRIR